MTASNSGMIRGACIIIEQSLGRPLLWLACWYHIHEVVLKNTYELLFGPSQVLRFLCSSDSEEDLSLVYLGGWSGDPPRFRASGAYHQARWMAKAIYILKIALFSQQLQLTRSERRGVPQLARFVSLIYVRFWHEAGVSNYALKSDLEFLATLQVFVDRKLGSTAEKALRRHLGTSRSKKRS